MDLAPIINSSESIALAYAPSLNAAFVELWQHFGFWPEVREPLGGARTYAEQLQLVREDSRNTMSSDHLKGRAVDIWNHQRFRNAGVSAFIQILAAHGWRNVQVNGRPFPSEPWHFANQSATPAGGMAIPIQTKPGKQPREEDDDMNTALRGLPTYKVEDKDGLNFLYPELQADGSVRYRILGRAGRFAPELQAEFNGIQAALGAGPGTVTRARFNELVKRLGALADA